MCPPRCCCFAQLIVRNCHTLRVGATRVTALMVCSLASEFLSFICFTYKRRERERKNEEKSSKYGHNSVVSAVRRTLNSSRAPSTGNTLATAAALSTIDPHIRAKVGDRCNACTRAGSYLWCGNKINNRDQSGMVRPSVRTVWSGHHSLRRRRRSWC